jgi:hypothetical protein
MATAAVGEKEDEGDGVAASPLELMQAEDEVDLGGPPEQLATARGGRWLRQWRTAATGAFGGAPDREREGERGGMGRSGLPGERGGVLIPSSHLLLRRGGQRPEPRAASHAGDDSEAGAVGEGLGGLTGPRGKPR